MAFSSQLNELTAKMTELESHTTPVVSSKNKKKKAKSKPDSSSDSESSSSSFSPEDEEYEKEKRRMRIKSYEKLKITSLPKAASEYRPWRNTLFASLAQCSKQSESYVYAWLQLAASDQDLSQNAEFPILSRVLGTKLLE